MQIGRLIEYRWVLHCVLSLHIPMTGLHLSDFPSSPDNINRIYEAWDLSQWIRDSPHCRSVHVGKVTTTSCEKQEHKSILTSCKPPTIAPKETVWLDYCFYEISRASRLNKPKLGCLLRGVQHVLPWICATSQETLPDLIQDICRKEGPYRKLQKKACRVKASV